MRKQCVITTRRVLANSFVFTSRKKAVLLVATLRTVSVLSFNTHAHTRVGYISLLNARVLVFSFCIRNHLILNVEDFVTFSRQLTHCSYESPLSCRPLGEVACDPSSTRRALLPHLLPAFLWPQARVEKAVAFRQNAQGLLVHLTGGDYYRWRWWQRRVRHDRREGLIWTTELKNNSLKNGQK